MQSTINDTIAALEALKDDKRRDFAKTSYPTQLQVLGVKNPDLKLVIKELRLVTKDWEPIQKLDLAKAFIRTGIMECVHLAYEYIGLEKKSLALFTEKDIPDFIIGLDNWVCVDTFGVHVLGIAWRNNQVKTKTIHQMALSDDFWIRRLALVATIPFNMKSRGGTGNTTLTLGVCSLLISDHHDMITKALSWALRELLPFDKTAVEAFLEEHQAELNNRVKRELKTKITTGKKN